MEGNWIKNDEVELHYIDSNPNNSKDIPLLISLGLSEPAENYIKFMTSLLPRRCIAFSHRGRGKSSSPDNGYTLELYVRDIEAIIK
ncbi:alpha/beta fold hydrolase [Evansella sp. AB-rgal1]|uniref:alpha/beta fold hydrolase n=1 Tax=Evansella sp. AB-rgal1 TaxID=3242696 RepID=UPI00359D97ED